MLGPRKKILLSRFNYNTLTFKRILDNKNGTYLGTSIDSEALLILKRFSEQWPTVQLCFSGGCFSVYVYVMHVRARKIQFLMVFTKEASF